VEKWRASLPNLLVDVTNNKMYNINKEVDSLHSTERNNVKSRKSSSCTNLQTGRKLDRDSGCLISSGRSNKISSGNINNVLLNKGYPQSDTLSDEISSLTSSQSDRQLRNKTMDIHPRKLKQTYDENLLNDVHKKLEGKHLKEKPDLEVSLNRIQRDLDFLKQNLNKPADSPPPPTKERKLKRTPVRATRDYSFTSGSDTESCRSLSRRNEYNQTGGNSRRKPYSISNFHKEESGATVPEDISCVSKSPVRKHRKKRSRSIPRTVIACKKCKKYDQFRKSSDKRSRPSQL